MPIELDVSQLGRVVLPREVLVLVIMVLPRVVTDIWEQMDIVREVMHL